MFVGCVFELHSGEFIISFFFVFALVQGKVAEVNTALPEVETENNILLRVGIEPTAIVIAIQ